MWGMLILVVGAGWLACHAPAWIGGLVDRALAPWDAAMRRRAARRDGSR